MREAALKDRVQWTFRKLYRQCFGVLDVISLHPSKIDKLIHHILSLVHVISISVNLSEVHDCLLIVYELPVVLLLK